LLQQFHRKNYYTLLHYLLFPTYSPVNSRHKTLSVVVAILTPPLFRRLLLFRPSSFKITMASADFLQFILPSLTGLSLWKIPFLSSGTLVRPPRVRAITFLPCNFCIYCMELVLYWTLFCYANPSIPRQPCMHFRVVSSAFCLQLPSDSASRRTPLPLANSSYCQACSGLSPPIYSPCRAHLDNAFSFGSEALPAPQAVLMSMIVDGIMSGNLPWSLIFIGAAAAATVELFGIGSLPFAVGLYLPITTTAPIMVGGLINGIIRHRTKD